MNNFATQPWSAGGANGNPMIMRPGGEIFVADAAHNGWGIGITEHFWK